MVNYVGILDGAGDVWGVRIPDVSGCVGGGSTPEAAIADAAQALRDVMTHKQNGGFSIPAPTPLADILSSGEVDQGESVVFIPLLLDAGRTVRANLTLDAGLLSAIDAAAAARNVSRSAFLADAAREKIIGT